MPDYITKAAAQKQMARFIGYVGIDEDLIERFKIAINQIPAEDVEPVVRCMDCRHAIPENKPNYWCDGRGWPMRLVHGFEFCSRGERKEDVSCG